MGSGHLLQEAEQEQLRFHVAGFSAVLLDYFLRLHRI